MYLYALTELDKRDSILAKAYRDKLHPQVKKDIDEYRNFLSKYRNQVEPVISWIYDGYLQANDQPEGKKTYNQVVAFLIAYYKKFGKEAL
jgi:nicotinamide riboside kinase